MLKAIVSYSVFALSGVGFLGWFTFTEARMERDQASQINSFLSKLYSESRENSSYGLTQKDFEKALKFGRFYCSASRAGRGVLWAKNTAVTLEKTQNPEVKGKVAELSADLATQYLCPEQRSQYLSDVKVISSRSSLAE